MREIKFRAWDIDNKTWTFVTLGDLVCGACTNDGDKPLSGSVQIWEPRTGLKDKNDNEIFVNDIIEMHYFEQYVGPGEVEKTVVGVVGKDSMGCFTRVGDKKYYWLHYLEDAEYYGDAEYNEELELLGNIHENPELLEEK